MGLTLDKLVFDPAATGDGASVGAYLRASDGTLLTHTDVGGKKALDVRLAEGVNVEVDLSHTDDSVRLGNGAAFFTSTSENSDIALDVHISNSTLEVKRVAGSSTAYDAAAITSTAALIIATPLANRRSVIIQNLGSKDIFVGTDNTVDAATGLKISAGSNAELELDATVNLYAVTASGTADVRYLEIAY